MRRGWMDWVPQEVPDELLGRRVGQVAQACQAQGLDAVLLFSNFVRPARVSALTHFVPFWSQAALAVTREGDTMLAMATTGRTVQLIRKCSVVDEVLVGPDIGQVAGQWLRGRHVGARIGIVDGDDWPQAALEGLKRAWPELALVDASPWYAPLDAGFGPAPAVARRALELARGGLAQVGLAPARDVHDVVAAVEGHCRSLGAEEVAVYMAPDLRQTARAHRLEGPTHWGDLFAVQLSVAYKGHWLRCAASFSRAGGAIVELPESLALRQRLQQAAKSPGVNARQLLGQIGLEPAPGALLDWSVESRCGNLPLACVVAPGHAESSPVPAFSTFSTRIQSQGHEWLLAEPLFHS